MQIRERLNIGRNYNMLEPIGDKLLIEPIPVDEVTAGGIIVPDTARTTPDKGKVLSIGDDVKSEKLTKGTVVLFRKNSGSSVHHAGTEYIILPVKEVIGIIKDKEE